MRLCRKVPHCSRKRKGALAVLSAALCLAVMFATAAQMSRLRVQTAAGILRWVDFDVTAEAMRDALAYDVASHGGESEIHWVDLLACLGARYGGDFSHYRKRDMEAIVKRIQDGESMEHITAGITYFDYYSTAYESVLGGLAGDYSVQTGTTDSGAPAFERQYGLKAFSPVAKGWAFSHSDDFGAGRSFGYKRNHLGHDLFGSVGTPVINVETCTVEALGWNRYGGWRIGMRSLDGRRYYYYAHLYHAELEGMKLTGGVFFFAEHDDSDGSDQLRDFVTELHDSLIVFHTFILLLLRVRIPFHLNCTRTFRSFQ